MPITRNRVIYAGTDVLVSDAPSWSGHQTGVTSLKLLKRVQSSSISISNPVTRSKQIGSSDFAFEKYIQTPTIEVGLDYICSDNSNELLLGLNATGNEGILKNLSSAAQDRNLFFILTDTNSDDAHALTQMVGNDIFSIGNSFLTNYSLTAEVGSVPKTSVSFSSLNMTFQTYNGTGTNGSALPAINLTNGIKSSETYMLTGASMIPENYLTNQNLKANALKPGDIELLLPQPIMGGIRYNGSIPASITSLSIDLPIERRDLLGFGSNYPYDKRIIFPIIGKLSFQGSFDEPVTGDFSDIFSDENNYDFTFNLKKNDGTTGLRIEILDARVESQSFNLSIGDDLTFSSEFTFKLTQNDGFRLSGSAQLYDSDAYEFLEAAQITDTVTRTGVNNFVKKLKTGTLWNKISGLYPLVGGTMYSEKFNLKDPRDLDAAYRLNFNTGSGYYSGPSYYKTFFNDNGVVFWGSGDYADTFINAQNNLPEFSAHLAYLSLEESPITGQDSPVFDSFPYIWTDLGAAANDYSSELMLQSQYQANTYQENYPATGIFSFYNSDDSSIAFQEKVLLSDPVDPKCFFIGSRIANNSSFLLAFDNSTTPTQSAESNYVIPLDSGDKPNKNLWIGKVNGPNILNDESYRSFGFVSIGQGLTSGECVEYYTAVKNLQIDIGRNAEVFYKRIPMVKQDFTNASLGTIPDVDSQYHSYLTQQQGKNIGAWTVKGYGWRPGDVVYDSSNYPGAQISGSLGSRGVADTTPAYYSAFGEGLTQVVVYLGLEFTESPSSFEMECTWKTFNLAGNNEPSFALVLGKQPIPDVLAPIDQAWFNNSLHLRLFRTSLLVDEWTNGIPNLAIDTIGFAELNADSKHRIRVDVLGNTIRLWINNRYIGDVTNSIYGQYGQAKHFFWEVFSNADIPPTIYSYRIYDPIINSVAAYYMQP
jgi:hypothetical protein